MVSWRSILSAIPLLWCGTVAAHAMPADCKERLLPPHLVAAAGKRGITARDLVELRDFGRPDDGPGREPFSLSPDGKFAALTLRRADPDSDSYCIAVLIVALDGRSAPRLLDIGGTVIPATSDVHGIPAIPSGLAAAASPIWSPDGKWLAYLRRDGSVTQIWLVSVDGQTAAPVTKLTTEPLALAWARDGNSIVFSTRRSLDAGVAEIAREGRTGYLYNERFWSLADARPHPKLPLPIDWNVVDPTTGSARSVSAVEAERMRIDDGVSAAGVKLMASSPGGARAWVEVASSRQASASLVLKVQDGQRAIRCSEGICRGPIAGLWWRGPGELLFLRAGEPENGGRTAVYRWRVRSDPRPQALFETNDWIGGCKLVVAALICARESSTRPRTLVRIDTKTGDETTVFDPNPEFKALRFGLVRRLTWTDRDCVATYGDLVLPPNHRPGERHPLIVVQYISRGFLRGGTGDEYPIHLLAARGYAVLSFQMPAGLPANRVAADANARQRNNVKDWAGRRRIFTALDAGIDAAIAGGAIDIARIGITGMSDGSSTVQHALIHSARFKAAAISSCCDDPSTVFSIGPSYYRSAKAWGYPAAGDDGRAFWAPQSLALNAHRLKVPLLMQLPDGEFRMAAEGYAALESHGAPIEMYVFPDERHTKFHPAHRLAIYERSIAWFDFWLRNISSSDPARGPELARWRALRDLQSTVGSRP